MTRFALLFGGIWFFVGAVLAVVFTVVGGPIWYDWILNRHAVETEAQVVGVERTSSKRDWQPVYSIRFRFIDLGGQEHHGQAGTTNRVLVESAQRGESVRIEYDPRAPGRRVRLIGESASFFGLVILVPVGFVVVGLVVFLLGYRALWRDRALYREGEAIEATVDGVTPTSMRMNRKRVMRVSYTFHHPAGDVHGVWRTTKPPAVGDTIWVIFDHRQPSRSMAVSP